VKKIIIASLFVSSTLYSNEGDCPWNDVLAKIQHEDLITQEKICESLPRIKSKKDMKEVLEFFFDQAQKKDDPDRHKATKKLNACRPSKKSKALVIAFEGTGAYEPLIPATMARFNKCFGGKVNKKILSKVYSNTREIFKDKKGKDSKWSGLQSGVMSEMMAMDGGRNVDWFSFPSEEVEQLAGLEKLKETSLKQLVDDVKNSVNSNPKGIQNARHCIKNYIKEAKALGITPKIVLTSHSSGGRSLVKFAEHMKRDVGVDVDLAFSIDPVKEAHHAVEEVLPQKLGEPLRYTRWKLMGGKGEDYPYSAVWSGGQPSSLYKASNVKEHINFYQKEDREGLKIGGDAMRFGIHGSPIAGADNHYIKGVGMSGHGEITYESSVVNKFNEKMKDILK
jgi:hypothetical protein